MSDEECIVRTISRMTKAFENGRVDEVMQAYEPEAGVAFAPGRLVTATPEIRATFEQWSTLSPRFEYSGHEVLIVGDVAMHIAPWRMHGHAPDGSAVEQRGLSI